MKGFKLITQNKQEIRFEFYLDAAPVTSDAFVKILPFTKTFFHAKTSGQEIWIDNVAPVNIIQENASIFTYPGEVVIGPQNAGRTKTMNCFGIYYGEGKGLDSCNIFAKVIEDDMQKLIDLGENIWKNGAQDLTFSLI